MAGRGDVHFQVTDFAEARNRTCMLACPDRTDAKPLVPNLTVTSFHIEEDADWVHLVDGATVDAASVESHSSSEMSDGALHCRNWHPFFEESGGSTMLLQFVADGTVLARNDSSGFRATFLCVPAADDPLYTNTATPAAEPTPADRKLLWSQSKRQQSRRASRMG